MTATSLLTAVTAGMVIGFAGHWIGRTAGKVPLWLPPAVGVGAALLGTVAARLAGIDTARVSPVEIVLQIGLAAGAVTAVALTTDRRPSGGRYDRTGSTR